MSDIQIPSEAVSKGSDIGEPTREILRGLRLLGNDIETEDANGISGVLGGPPQSVALIEAGATAAAKWWAAGLGVSVIAAWGSVLAWWADQPSDLKMVVAGGVSLVTAALALSIGYLIASDVRGRAAAAVATINARASVARTMIQAAESAYVPASDTSASQIIPLPAGIKVKNTLEPAANEDGWLAVAFERDPSGTIKYIVVKDSSQTVVAASSLEFVLV